MLYFLHFLFKTIFITAEKIFFQKLALITFELSNERHLIHLLIKNQIIKSRNLKKYHSLAKKYHILTYRCLIPTYRCQIPKTSCHILTYRCRLVSVVDVVITSMNPYQPIPFHILSFAVFQSRILIYAGSI